MINNKIAIKIREDPSNPCNPWSIKNMIVVSLHEIRGNSFASLRFGFKITREEYSAVVENIRNQDDYFKAMNAAQPVVDEVARVAKEVLKDLKNAQDGARLEVAPIP